MTGLCRMRAYTQRASAFEKLALCRTVLREEDLKCKWRTVGGNCPDVTGIGSNPLIADSARTSSLLNIFHPCYLRP